VLVPWSFTFAASKGLFAISGCHGLVPWSFTFAASKELFAISGCHGLVPWSFTFAASKELFAISGCHGLVPWSFTFNATKKGDLLGNGLSRAAVALVARVIVAASVKAPRGKARGILENLRVFFVAASVKAPRGKPVASWKTSVCFLCRKCGSLLPRGDELSTPACGFYPGRTGEFL